MSVVQVALPIPKRQLFDYRNQGADLEVGCRVTVPFGNRTLIGVVMGKQASSDYDPNKLKGIDGQLDKSPIFSGTQLNLCHWLSRYYQHPIGEVLSTALPAVLRKGESSEPKPIVFLGLTEQGKQTEPQSLSRSPKQKMLLETLVKGEKPLHPVHCIQSMQAALTIHTHNFLISLAFVL